VQVVIEHAFALASCEAFEAVFFDEPYNVALGEALQMGRVLKRLEQSATRVVRVVGYEPQREKGSAAEALGSSRRGFVEELDYDLRAHEGTWKTVPNAFADRVRNAGTIELTMRGAEVVRVVRADIVVKLFGFGGRVEKLIAAEIEKSYARSATFMREWVSVHRGG
jgi:hypothetical protein